jgi:hypothetical protein
MQHHTHSASSIRQRTPSLPSTCLYSSSPPSLPPPPPPPPPRSLLSFSPLTPSSQHFSFRQVEGLVADYDLSLGEYAPAVAMLLL